MHDLDKIVAEMDKLPPKPPVLLGVFTIEFFERRRQEISERISVQDMEGIQIG